MDPIVESIHINIEHRQPVSDVENAHFIAGVGIENDRHATPRSERQGYQVLLMDKETLDSTRLSPGEIKENITTVGMDINSLQVGQQLALGNEAIIEVFKPCPPCSRMDEIRPSLQDELVRQRGVLAQIVQSGTVKIGDRVHIIDPDTRT